MVSKICCHSGRSNFSICYPSSSLLETGQLLQKHEIYPGDYRWTLGWTSAGGMLTFPGDLFVYVEISEPPFYCPKAYLTNPSSRKRIQGHKFIFMSHTPRESYSPSLPHGSLNFLPGGLTFFPVRSPNSIKADRALPSPRVQLMHGQVHPETM